MKWRRAARTGGAMAAALVSFCPPPGAADDFGTWNGVSLKTLDTKYLDLTSSAELRFNDDSTILHQYKLTESVGVKALRYLGFGVNYTYNPTRSAATGDFQERQRIELDAAPRWPVTDRLTLEFRQRLELRWLEGQSGISEVSRHRAQATCALSGLGRLTSVFASDEVFYNYERGAVSANRFIPLGLHFQFNRHVGLNAYYMFHSVHPASGGWQNAHILGTQLSLAF